jgi:hypothetical protein
LRAISFGRRARPRKRLRERRPFDAGSGETEHRSPRNKTNLAHTARFFALCALLLLGGCVRTPSIAPGQAVSVPPTPPIDTAGIRFEETAASSGLNYVWPTLPRPLRNLEAFGAGCAFLDYDNDGWQDILLVARPYCRLYHNLKNGRFADVTAEVGLDKVKGYWTGCAVGDYDGDGALDIVLTGYHCLAVLHNVHGKQFRDTTAAAGFDPHNRGHWGASAGFMDLAGHGRLDLVLLNYVIFGPKEPQTCSPAPGITTGCPPTTYRPEFGEIWENVGKGRFREIDPSAGMRATHGKALVVAFVDPDAHGKMDFYIGNDGTPAEFMRNEGKMRFTNIGVASGVAYGALDHAIAAMGADLADYDRDGKPDLIVTGFSDESFALFHNVGNATFEQTSDKTGLSGPTFKPLGFGAKWIDVDNDGWPDLAFTCGHVYDTVNQTDPQSTFHQPMMLFHNIGGQSFQNLAPTLGGALAKPILGRGLATGDFDNDGRMDMLAVDMEGAPILLHNVSTSSNHWITLDLRAGGENRFAYGAQVQARGGGQTWIGQVSPASSYLSSSDPRVHFGLGPVQTLDEVNIRWPDGRREVLHNVEGDKILTVTEGKGITGRL